MKSRTKSIQTARVAKDVHVQLSLPVAGVLYDVQSAFFGLCIDAGKAVLGAMMEAERTALCGPKGCPDATRTAYRGGHTRSQIVLGGRRIAIARPRARAVASAELSLPTFTWAAHADPLERATIAAIAAGVSTRRYQRTLDALPAKETQSSVSKSAVSRRFVALPPKNQWRRCPADATVGDRRRESTAARDCRSLRCQRPGAGLRP